jgi:hypothetical protein
MDGREYPGSGEVQPRYAAWLGSIGLPTTEAGVHAAWERYGGHIGANLRMMQFIGRAKATAPSSVLFRGERDGSIVDHDAFTEHCWCRSFSELLENFPS